MHLGPFSTARLPAILYGEGRFAEVPVVLEKLGKNVLLVTGGRSFCESPNWVWLTDKLAADGFSWEHMKVQGEPSPDLVDNAVREFRDAGIEVVVGIGGGSVLDAAKAIAGLLPHGNSVMDHLEGVGPELPYQGPSVPFIAVPTTAGTGSEATKNAVLSVQGAAGFKKSFRDEQLVARYAVIDPLLLATCPPELIAANGMDALTQLLESYVSSRANPFTDALALSGLEAAAQGLLAWYEGGEGADDGRRNMAYAALLSGITLAQAGLGSVHGLASPLGAFFPIPHGVVCGTLVATATEINIRALRAREPANPALAKYAHLAAVLSGGKTGSNEEAWETLARTLADWVERMELPRLSRYGVKASDLAGVVAGSRGSSMKTNPIVLTDDEVAAVLEHRL